MDEYISLERPNTSRAAFFGLLIAAVAIGLRVLLSADSAGDQAIFTYPAIIIATLFFGMAAGCFAAGACLLALWYFVIPVQESFEFASAANVITLGTCTLVGASLIAAIGTMRGTLRRYSELASALENVIEERTAERNRVWERSREFVAIVDSEGTIRTANPALLAKTRLRLPELQARKLDDLFQQNDRRFFYQACALLDAGETAPPFEARLDIGGVITWVTWSMVSDGRWKFLVGRDFTAEHECTEQLQQSQKMELVGQMTGGLAHDFANLLSPITMTLDVLRSRHAEDDRSMRLLALAGEAADRAADLIQRLLTFSRPTATQLRMDAPSARLRGLVPLLQQAIGSRQLLVEIEDGLPTVFGDPRQLDMALLNLIVNARDATAENGLVTLSAAMDGGDRIAITVSDNGSGMDAQTLNKVLEPFFSTKPVGQGTGLGLVMVQKFAISAGGSLSLQSEPGQGTRVTILLPVAAEGTEAAMQGASSPVA